MRGILVLLGLLILAAVVLMSLGMLKINWQSGQFPTAEFKMDGGKLPTIQTGTVDIGTTNVTVSTPKLEMGNTVVTIPTVEVRSANSSAPAQ